jgi:hypothetical protein
MKQRDVHLPMLSRRCPQSTPLAEGFTDSTEQTTLRSSQSFQNEEVKLFIVSITCKFHLNYAAESTPRLPTPRTGEAPSPLTYTLERKEGM